MSIKNPFKKVKKTRDYPIKLDVFRKSARKRAFVLFDKGIRPAKAAPEVGISKRTAYRYFESWKKLPRNFEQQCEDVRMMLKESPELRESTLKTIAGILGYPVAVLKDILAEPWGLRRVMMGKLTPKPRIESMTKEHARLEAALSLIGMFERVDVSPEQLKKEVGELLEMHREEWRKQREKEISLK